MPGAMRNRVVPSSPDRLSIPAMNVRWMIYTAYQQGMGTSWNVSGGPEWVDQTFYAIEGKAAKPSTQRELRMMLRTLLTERFGLKIRQEVRTGAPGSGGIYTLILDRPDGKLGPNIQEWDGMCGGKPPSDATDADDLFVPRCSSGYFAGGIFVEGGTLFSAAELLSLPQSRQLLGTIVQDRTGLTGRYKLRLLFDFAAAAAALRSADPAGQPAFAPPSLFDAVREQWGMRLVRGEGPLNVIVVESVERPTEN
ncbi:MAG: TIGR03435 family protein [Acidobacteriota bacterium]